MCVGWVEGSQGWRRISWVLQGSARVLGTYSSPRWIRDGGRKEKVPSPRSLTFQNWVVLLENDCLEGKPGPLEKQHAPGYKDRQSWVSWWYNREHRAVNWNSRAYIVILLLRLLAQDPRFCHLHSERLGIYKRLIWRLRRWKEGGHWNSSEKATYSDLELVKSRKVSWLLPWQTQTTSFLLAGGLQHYQGLTCLAASQRCGSKTP